GPLLRRRHLGGGDEVVEGGALRPQRGALVDAGQEAGAPVLRVPLGDATAERVVHDDERRQVLALGAQAVGHPRAQAREAQAPHWPWRAKANGDFMSGPTWSLKNPVAGSKPFSSWPSRLASSGL